MHKTWFLLLSVILLLIGCGPSDEPSSNKNTTGSQSSGSHSQASTAITATTTVSNYHALVIGNNNYQHVSELTNAVSDARAIAEKFRNLGYQVTLALDRTYNKLWDDIEGFAASIAKDDQVIVFYAGHGVQIDNNNFLIPIDLNATQPSHVERDSIELSTQLLAKIHAGQPRFVLAIIDACRDNPFHSLGRSFGAKRGLTAPNNIMGTMIVYSAGVGQEALDSLTDNDPIPHGLFTRELLTAIATPNVTINEAFGRLKQRVYTQAKSVGHLQTPAIYDQSIGTFYFRPSQTNTTMSVTLQPVPTNSTSVPTVQVPVSPLQQNPVEVRLESTKQEDTVCNFLIEEPKNNTVVFSPRVAVQGKSSGCKTKKSIFTVLLLDQDGDYYSQGRILIMPDGSWSAPVYLGPAWKGKGLDIKIAGVPSGKELPNDTNSLPLYVDAYSTNVQVKVK
ncbi:hypothetical protein TI05_07305 [Achromatium sp. WMS3]|nr:hypothetical protein TI05_07305 [Achromatium sp. WMS3]